MLLGLCVTLAFAASAPTSVVRYDAHGPPPQTQSWLPVLAYNQWGADPFTAPDPKLFAQYAQRVALTDKGKSVAFEVWNEPNMGAFWHPPDPVAYAKLYSRTKAAIRRVDKKTPVLIGGIADINGWETFTKRVLKLTKPDGLALHPYNDPVGSTRKAIKLGVPVWVTEVGIGRERVTEAYRGRYLLRTIRALRKLKIKSLFVYSWANDPAWSVAEGPAKAALLKGYSEPSP